MHDVDNIYVWGSYFLLINAFVGKRQGGKEDEINFVVRHMSIFLVNIYFESDEMYLCFVSGYLALFFDLYLIIS